MDNLRAHHAKPVKAWLAEAHNSARIEVFISAGLLTGTESGRLSELRFEGGGAFKAPGQRRQTMVKAGTRTHEDFAEITRPDTKILQASQDRLCRMTCNIFNCRVNSYSVLRFP